MAGPTDIMTLLIEYLSSQSSIKALVGNNPCKVFPGDVPLKVGGNEIHPPWLNLKRGEWDEVVHFRGGTGTYICPTTVIAHGATAQIAGQIYDAVYALLANKWSETWSDRLWVSESTMSLGQSVELLEADGSPSKWQQVEGVLNLICCIRPA